MREAGASDLRVVRLVSDASARLLEGRAAELPGDELTAGDVHGRLNFTGARTLEARFPTVGDAGRPLSVPRLGRRGTLGATSLIVLATLPH